MQMVNLCKLSLSQLKERWSHDDPDVVGDEMIEYARFIQSHNLMPVKGIETLIGPHIIRECGMQLKKNTIEFKDATVTCTLHYLGRGKFFTYIEKDKQGHIINAYAEETTLNPEKVF